MTRRRGSAQLALAPPPGLAVAPVPRRLRAEPGGALERRRAARRALVPRERLVRALAAADDAPLRAIVAPAGYGKTTLLRQWAECDPRPFAWLTAGPGDADGGRLLTDVVRTVATRTAPFVLVVDEAECLESPDAGDLLVRLQEGLPPGSLLALASRSEPPLALGRLRARGEVVELGARDLAMTRGEAREMLAAAGVVLGAREIDALVARTEGWPAGLRLAALALRDQDDLRAALEQFAGDDRLVADYVRDELLSRLADDDLDFLLGAAELDELSGPLCDAALGARGSGRRLRALARAGLPLAPLDRSDERFRLRRLPAETLRAELRRADPERAAAIHRRAAEWYAADGDVEHAITHATAAGETRRAAELIWAAVPQYAAYGHEDTLARWLGRFTDDELAAHSELALATATTHIVRGDRDLVERWALIAATALDDVADDRRDGVEAGLAIMRAAVARDGIARMREDAARAYELEPEASPWRAICCLLIGLADVFAGDTAEGRRRLEEGARRGAMRAPSIQVMCLASLALVELMEGRQEPGARLAELAHAQLERVGLEDYATCALVYAVSALSRAQRGRVTEARQDVRDARRLITALRRFTPIFVGTTALALARAELRLGDVLDARALLEECDRAVGETPDAPALRAWVGETWERAEVFADDADGSVPLTAAELRVLQFLPTHLPFREVAGQLRVSANTVKTQAHALYRKLGASSRSEAVARARALGLLDT